MLKQTNISWCQVTRSFHVTLWKKAHTCVCPSPKVCLCSVCILNLWMFFVFRWEGEQPKDRWLRQRPVLCADSANQAGTPSSQAVLHLSFIPCYSFCWLFFFFSCLSAGDVWCRSPGLPAGGHHQHYSSQGPTTGSQARPIKSHRSPSRCLDEALEPAAVQLSCSQEEASGGSRALQKGKQARRMKI